MELRPTFEILVIRLFPDTHRPFSGDDRINQAHGSVDPFNIGQLPRLVEEGFLRPIEAAEDLESTVLLRGDPVALKPIGRFGSEVEIDRPIVSDVETGSV